VQSDEVEHGAHRLAGSASEAAAELLEEQRGALRRAEHQQRVDSRDVDALIEQIDGEQHRDPTSGEIVQRLPSLVGRRGTPHGASRDASTVKLARHEPGVLDADAEPQCTHASDVGDPFPQLPDQRTNPQIARRVDVRQRLDVIALASPPWRETGEVPTCADIAGDDNPLGGTYGQGDVLDCEALVADEDIPEREGEFDTAISDAAAECGVEANVGDDGDSISFDTKGDEESFGDDLGDMACVLTELDTPDHVISRMDSKTT
jgi:hypothetical protein